MSGILGISGGPVKTVVVAETATPAARRGLIGKIVSQQAGENTYIAADGGIGTFDDFFTSGHGGGGDNLEIIYSCNKVIVESMMQLRPMVTGGDVEHPRVGVNRLFRRPNPYQSWPSLIEAVQRDYNLWGNAFIFIERDPSGVVSHLWPLEAWCMSATLEADGGGGKVLVYTDGSTRWVQRMDGSEPPTILHVHQNSRSALPQWGASPITKLRESMLQAASADTYARRLFTQGGSARYALVNEFEDDGGEQAAEAAKAWNAATRGASNMHTTPVLTGGYKPHPLDMSMVDMAFIESVKLSRERLAAAFQVPPVRIGAFERATFSNMRSQVRSFARSCIVPIVRRWEAEMNHVLLLDHPRYRIEFDLTDFLKSEPEELAKIYAVLHDHGVVTARKWAEDQGIKWDEDNPPSDEYHDYGGGGGSGAGGLTPADEGEGGEEKPDPPDAA